MRKTSVKLMNRISLIPMPLNVKKDIEINKLVIGITKNKILISISLNCMKKL